MKFEKIIENNISIIIIFIVVSFITFYKSIFFTFIHDDWGILEAINNTSLFEFIKPFIDIERVLIRPVFPAYDWLIYNLFGLNPIMPHIMSLLINSLNAFLVFLISEIILKDKLSAFAVGFLYASAVIHSESVSWALNPPDDLCMVFFLASFLLFIKEKYLTSVLFFITALFTKEAAVFLPIALFFYGFFFTDTGKNTLDKFKTCFWKARYHFIILFLFLIVRFLLSPDVNLPDSHPYKIKIFGIHIIENALGYIKFILTEVFPTSLYYGMNYLELSFLAETTIVLIIFSIIGAIYYYAKSRKIHIHFDRKIVLFCILFLGAGLGPVIFLPNHNYRYYLTLPSLSFLILIVYFIQKLLEIMNFSKNKQKTWLVYYLVFHFVLSSVNYNYIYSEHSSHAKQNEMSRKLHTYMIKNYPALSNDSIVIIKGMNIFAINRSSALRVWYQDDSLEVFNFNDFVIEGGKYFIKDPLLTQREAFTGERVKQKIELRHGKTVIIEYINGNYFDITYKYFG